MDIKMRYKGFRSKALTLSYDDGVYSDIEFINILNKYNIKATFNLNSGLFNKDGMYIRRLTKDEALKLYLDSGMEVAAHTATHLNLIDLDINAAKKEIVDDIKELSRLFNTDILGFAYPFGTYNDRLVDILKDCGIIYARTTEETNDFKIPTNFLKMSTTCRHKNPKLLELGKIYKELDSDEATLFTLWGHTYEFYKNDNFSLIEDFFKIIGNDPDIYYATNRDIVEYINAYKSLTVDKKKIINNTKVDLYLNIDGENVLLKHNTEITINN